MRPGRWTFTGWALAISGGLGALLLVLIFFLQARVEDQRARYAKAETDYKKAIRLRIRYRELEVLKSKMPPQSDQTQSWPVFLDQKAKEAGLPTLVVVPELAVKGPPRELPFTVSLDAPAGSAISRQKFVKFLESVESQRPAFKSKYIRFKFSAASPEDLSQASATFSHFDR